MASKFGHVASSLYLISTAFSGLLADQFDPAQTYFSPFICLVLESIEIILALWDNTGSMEA